LIALPSPFRSNKAAELSMIARWLALPWKVIPNIGQCPVRAS
jgi:hypothetical protein